MESGCGMDINGSQLVPLTGSGVGTGPRGWRPPLSAPRQLQMPDFSGEYPALGPTSHGRWRLPPSRTWQWLRLSSVSSVPLWVGLAPMESRLLRPGLARAHRRQPHQQPCLKRRPRPCLHQSPHRNPHRARNRHLSPNLRQSRTPAARRPIRGDTTSAEGSTFTVLHRGFAATSTA